MKVRRLAVWSSALLLSCEGPTMPVGGAISVRGSVAGGSDPNGFELLVDRRAAVPFDGIGPLVFAPLTPGTHRVELTGLSANCHLDVSGAQAVVVGEADTALVSFSVNCESIGSGLEVTAATEGVELDPNGYTVTVDDAPAGKLDRNGRFSGSVAPGVRRVGLSDVTPNCAVGPANPQQLEFVLGGIASLGFEVQCTLAPPAGRGHEIAFVRALDPGAELHLINEDGTGIRVLQSLPETTIVAPRWSPDGNRILMSSFSNGGRTGELRIFDLGSGAVERIPDTGNASDAAWSPDGAHIAFEEGDPDGRFSNLFLMEPNGANRRPLTQETAQFDSQPAWSPDGSRIAYVQRDGNGTRTLKLVNPGDLTSVELEKVTDFGGLRLPAWSPDGSRIAYVQDDGFEVVELRVITVADRSVAVLAETEAETSDLEDVAWSPDGTSIVFTKFVSSGWQILVARPNEPEPHELTRAGEDNPDPSWSPDGRIVFTSTRDGTPELYVMDADGTNQVRITNNEFDDGQAAWRP